MYCIFFQCVKPLITGGVCMVSGGVWTVSGWCQMVSGLCLDSIYVRKIEHSWIRVIIYSYCFFSQCPYIGYTRKKVEIKNRRWPYSFSQIDPMLFRVFGPKLTKKSPPGRPPVNSNFGGLPPPPYQKGDSRIHCHCGIVLYSMRIGGTAPYLYTQTRQ